MPRKSTDALSIRVDGRPDRLAPPKAMSPEAAAIFRSIVASCQPEHFTRSDLPLLTAYCEAVALQEQAVAELRTEGPVIAGKPSAWLIVAEKAWRATVALSLRLRLAPQSRYDARAAQRRATGPNASGLDAVTLEDL